MSFKWFSRVRGWRAFWGRRVRNGLLASYIEMAVSCVSDHPGDEILGHIRRRGRLDEIVAGEHVDWEKESFGYWAPGCWRWGWRGKSTPKLAVSEWPKGKGRPGDFISWKPWGKTFQAERSSQLNHREVKKDEGRKLSLALTRWRLVTLTRADTCSGGTETHWVGWGASETWRLVTPDSSFKDSCLKEEQNDWALAGDGPGVKGDVACVCC